MKKALLTENMIIFEFIPRVSNGENTFLSLLIKIILIFYVTLKRNQGCYSGSRPRELFLFLGHGKPVWTLDNL